MDELLFDIGPAKVKPRLRVVKPKKENLVYREAEKWTLLGMLHEAGRHKRGTEVEEIEREFLRRDRIKVNETLWGERNEDNTDRDAEEF